MSNVSHGGLQVCILQDSDRPRWDAFVRACPQATFFHLSAWRDLISQVWRHKCYFVYAQRDGEIVAVLPLAAVPGDRQATGGFQRLRRRGQALDR